jgi:hypothetical protein
MNSIVRLTTICENSISKNFSSVPTNSKTAGSSVKLMRMFKACSAIFYK